jgi:hypothetical protein
MTYLSEKQYLTIKLYALGLAFKEIDMLLGTNTAKGIYSQVKKKDSFRVYRAKQQRQANIVKYKNAYQESYQELKEELHIRRFYLHQVNLKTFKSQHRD